MLSLYSVFPSIIWRPHIPCGIRNRPSCFIHDFDYIVESINKRNYYINMILINSIAAWLLPDWWMISNIFNCWKIQTFLILGTHRYPWHIIVPPDNRPPLARGLVISTINVKCKDHKIPNGDVYTEKAAKNHQYKISLSLHVTSNRLLPITNPSSEKYEDARTRTRTPTFNAT